jgi:predicted dehydrogenase
MAAVHSRAARAASARLVAISSSSEARALEAATALGVERGVASLQELLSDAEIDVVHICTPNGMHAEQALASIAAGRHVVCEKPLATNSADAEAMLAAANEAGVVATVPFVYRFHPMVREARARFQNGEAGRLLSVKASYLQDWLVGAQDDNWRVDAAAGGPSRAFADIGSHLVDLVEFVTGDRITRVAATKRTFFADRPTHAVITTEDAVAVVLETESGAIGSLLVSQVAPGRKNRLHFELAGSAESLGFDQENPDSLWVGRRAGTQVLARDPEQLHPDAARLSLVPPGHPQGYQDAFNAFVADTYRAINGEVLDGLPNFADGLRAVRVTEAVIAAANEERWVAVPAA